MKQSKLDRHHHLSQRQHRRLALGLCLGAGILFPAHATFAQSATMIEVTTDTVLSADVVGKIEIKASNVTLDCAGHLVVSASPGQGIGIYFDYVDGMRVENCRVEGFCTGIAFSNINDSELVANLVTDSSLFGGSMSQSYGAQIIAQSAHRDHRNRRLR